MDIWPKIEDTQKAIDASHWQAGICFFVGMITGIAAIVSIFVGHKVLGLDAWALLDSGIFFFFGWRIWKLSIICSVLALGLYCMETIYKLASAEHSSTPYMALVFIYGMIQGVRGTFEYNRQNKIASSQIETIVDGTGTGQPQLAITSNRNWRKWITIGLSLSVGIVISIGALIWAVNSYENRPTEPKTWPVVQVTATGINVTLKTQYKSDLKYVLQVEPSSTDYSSSFDYVTGNLDNISLTFMLYDNAGFLLCSVYVEGLTRVIGPDGKTSALESNGDTSTCSSSSYREAATWNITYKFPALFKSAPSPTAAVPELVQPSEKIEPTKERPTGLTGAYFGATNNRTAGISAKAAFYIHESKGKIEGCFIVSPPLHGSGTVSGRIVGGNFEVQTSNPAMTINFTGAGTNGELSGNYTVDQPKSRRQVGTFTLQKAPLSESSLNSVTRYCPTDDNDLVSSGRLTQY